MMTVLINILGAQQEINNLTTHIAGMVTVGIIKPDFARELLGSMRGDGNKELSVLSGRTKWLSDDVTC